MTLSMNRNYFQPTIGEILGKVLPIDPQVNPIWHRSRLDLLLQQYHIRKSWQLLTRRYFLLFPTKKVFCLQYFDLFLVEKWHMHISLRKPRIIVFNRVKIADYKSTPMKLIFFRFGFADRISNPNLPNVFSSLVTCSTIGPRWTGVPLSMVFRKYW